MGTKRSVLKDEKGLPLAVVISGANTHHIKLMGETLDHIVVPRPKSVEKHPQNLCLDAGYTGIGKAIEQRDYIEHIRPRGEEKRSWNETLTFTHAAGLLRLHTLFSIVFANSWFVMKKRLKTTWPYANLPALLLFGVSLFGFIANFGISY